MKITHIGLVGSTTSHDEHTHSEYLVFTATVDGEQQTGLAITTICNLDFAPPSTQVVFMGESYHFEPDPEHAEVSDFLAEWTRLRDEDERRFHDQLL